MRKIIIGSTAIKHHFPIFHREGKDIDYAVDIENVNRKNEICKIDNKNVEYLYNPIIFNYISDNQLYATPEQILTLKMSHISWNINFRKHMFDIQFLLDQGVIYDKNMYNDLYNFWIDFKGRNGKYRRSDLTLSSEKFFDNSIDTDHDHLHTLLTDIPMYTKILKDGCDVEPCEHKFNNLSYSEKISVIEEEVMVMAYERFRDKQYRVAYEMMLEKFVTGHAPIWQLIFIIENYKILRKPSFNYYNKIENKLTNKLTNKLKSKIMKLTGKEIIEKITENLEEPYEFENLTDDSDNFGLGEAEMVDDQEHTNGDAWRVIHFKEHDVYIKQNGYYDSYESCTNYENHDYDVVVPFEITVIKYKVED